MDRCDVGAFRRELSAFIKTYDTCADDLDKFILMNYDRLPLYYSDRYCHLDSIRERYAEHDVRGVKLIKVSIDKIIGQGWLFTGRIIPYSKTLANLIVNYLASPDSLFIQAIFATELPNGKYFVNDGGHRIYAAFLLGINDVKLEIDKYALEKGLFQESEQPG